MHISTTRPAPAPAIIAMPSEPAIQTELEAPNLEGPDATLLAAYAEYERARAYSIKCEAVSTAAGNTDLALEEECMRASNAEDTIADKFLILPAQTPAGLRAKAAVARLWLDRMRELNSPLNFDEELVDSLIADLLNFRDEDGVGKPAAAPESNPDADLIRICAEHIANRQAYNTSGPKEREVLWEAYERTRDAIGDARPKTLAGMQAIARAAKDEAGSDGSYSSEVDSLPLDWAWSLMDTLLQINGDVA